MAAEPKSGTGAVERNKLRFGFESVTKMSQLEGVGLIETVVREAIASLSGNNSRQDFETPLFEGGLELDSISFLDLVMEIEGKLGLRLHSEDLTGDAVQTIGGLIRHIVAVMPNHSVAQHGTSTPD